jgi:hypothetical protein
MFTVLLTLAGIVAFIFSLFGAGIKSGFKRLGGFVITGIVLDVIVLVIFVVVSLCVIN